MKLIVVAVVASLLVVQNLAGEVVMRRKNGEFSTKYITSVIRRSSINDYRFDMCPICINFADESIQMLEELALDVTVIDTCQALCNALATKTGSQILGMVCQILCDAEGIKEFIKALRTVDLDDIYFCELIRACPIFDQGDASITDLSISPVSGPQGKRTIELIYISKNGTGTGQIEIKVITVDKFPVDARLFNEAGEPGIRPYRFILDAEGNCDPPCEQWKEGNYTLIVSVCNGECGSKHPHSKIYDSRSVNFTITHK